MVTTTAVTTQMRKTARVDALMDVSSVLTTDVSQKHGNVMETMTVAI